MLGRIRPFCSDTVKTEAVYFLLCIGIFLVVLVECSVCLLLSAATAVFWNDELCLEPYLLLSDEYNFCAVAF